MTAKLLLCGIAACVVSAALGAGMAWQYADALHASELADIRASQAAALQSAQAAALEQERTARATVQALEVKYANNSDALLAAREENAALAARLGHYNGAKQSNVSGGMRPSADNSAVRVPKDGSSVAPTCAATCTNISAGAADALVGIAYRADRAAAYAASCYEWIQSIKDNHGKGN